MGVWIGIAAALAAALTLAYLYIRPALGGKPSPESRERIRRSKQYRDGEFAYPLPTPMLSGWKDQVSILGEFLKGTPQAVPDRPLDVERYSPASAAERENAVRVTWFGHSAVLLELGDMTVFLDPMLGRAPSPVPMIGGSGSRARRRSTWSVCRGWMRSCSRMITTIISITRRSSG